LAKIIGENLGIQKESEGSDFTPIFTDLGKIKKKARDYGKVIISNNCTLVSCEVFNSQIYTVDSDFMIRTWNISDGECSQSTIVKQCPKYYDLMSRSDKFRQDQAEYSTADNNEGL
jgi:hypothetical protein